MSKFKVGDRVTNGMGGAWEVSKVALMTDNSKIGIGKERTIIALSGIDRWYDSESFVLASTSKKDKIKELAKELLEAVRDLD